MEPKNDQFYNQYFVEIDILNQFEAIFKYANEGIVISDSQSRILKINPSGLKTFGYDIESEIIGQKIEILIPQRFQHNHIGHREKYMENPHARSMGLQFDLFAVKKDGIEFPVEVSLSPFKNSLGSFVICFIIDITNRKKSEENEKNYRKELEKEVEERTLILKEAIQKLEKTKNELDSSLKREQELNSMKTKFISIASHEFRTPLSTILSSLSLMEKYNELNEVEKRNKHNDRIKKSIKNLTEILNDILSVNKIEEGKVIINPENFNLNNFVNDLILDLHGLLKPGQKLNLIASDIDEITVYQDPKLLRHILINLLTNAIKFSDEDKPIDISINTNDTEVHFSVKDYGLGIPKIDHKKLFTRFFRSSNVENIQGTGLGLSIVLQYVNYLKGTIKFSSEVGKGSIFNVNLPRNLKTSKN
ncbi:PAS domain-containing sensor histidine kinase [Lacihabitans sp. CCS-44]|uniref:PAS domain-containing sensor histidine kinase n=1 Tax=Lacihabitans sp. CCS-44 TaxID=2487331 RepID=UPI0020CC7AC2|nr:PAS domain-containing sensor histidine kinase [Lacihabitans sp. CCS-44]MCP9756346.1 PAS domain-containing sensor histidine kinase [Lacihabitans sp. CCS-44]